MSPPPPSKGKQVTHLTRHYSTSGKSARSSDHSGHGLQLADSSEIQDRVKCLSRHITTQVSVLATGRGLLEHTTQWEPISLSARREGSLKTPQSPAAAFQLTHSEAERRGPTPCPPAIHRSTSPAASRMPGWPCRRAPYVRVMPSLLSRGSVITEVSSAALVTCYHLGLCVAFLKFAQISLSCLLGTLCWCYHMSSERMGSAVVPTWFLEKSPAHIRYLVKI